MIIGVTGQTEEAYLLKAYRNGMNGVTTKPIDLKMVEAVMMELNLID